MSQRKARIVGLITDFGVKDSYIGELKVAFFASTQLGHIIDISHQVSVGDVKSCSYLLSRALLVFPDDSVFVAVVDPGVGSDRQAVIIRSGKRILIGPDNGVFARAICWDEDFEVRLIGWEDIDHNRRSNTFHGRDLFAPVAAQIVEGKDFREIGIPGQLKNTYRPATPCRTNTGFRGTVLYIDTFGNVATDIPNQASGKIKLGIFDEIEYSESYSSHPDNELFWLHGSDGCIEIALNCGHAGEKTGVLPDDPVEIYEIFSI